MKTGRIIKNHRKIKNIKLREIADELKVDVSFVSKIELGTRVPTQAHAKIISKMLDIPIEELQTSLIKDAILKQHKKSKYFGAAIKQIFEYLSKKNKI